MSDFVFIDEMPEATEAFERVAALEAQVAALTAEIGTAHRVIDNLGLSRCGDSHATVNANGVLSCDNGKPPLVLGARIQWLIDMSPDDWSGDDIVALKVELKAAAAQAAALKRAVEAVEWEGEGPGFEYCPWCAKKRNVGHAHNCARQAALGLSKE